MKKYEESVSVFFKFVEATRKNIEDLRSSKFHIKSQKQILPFGQLRLVFEALLEMVNILP